MLVIHACEERVRAAALRCITDGLCAGVVLSPRDAAPLAPTVHHGATFVSPPLSNAHRHVLRNYFPTVVNNIVSLWLKPCSLKPLSLKKNSGGGGMTNFTLVCEIAKQVTVKERFSMAGLYTVSMPLDMCSTVVEKINYPWSLLLEPVCFFKQCGAGCPSSCSDEKPECFSSKSTLEFHWVLSDL